MCRNKIKGNCDFADDICWWNHAEKRAENNTCYICNEIFQSKSMMMRHWKKQHSNIIKECSQFAKNNCRYQDDSCWYRPDIRENNEDEGGEEKTNNEGDSELDFQEVLENLEPPLNKSQWRRNQK